jgi:hypothetical protein
MAIEYGIRVVDTDGDGVEGVKVFVSYSWTWHEDLTNDDGWVHFEKENAFPPFDIVTADIFVDDDKVADQISIEDGDTFSFTI